MKTTTEEHEALAELAALKRYTGGNRKGWVTLNVPDEMMGRVDAALASPPPEAALCERIEQLEALLRELQTARPLLLYGEQWLLKIKKALA
jgi:hypothetical protein